MDRILMAYFSGTFGTEFFVKGIEKGLTERGIKAELFPIDLSKVESLTDANDKISEVDRVVLAYPVY